MTLSDTEIQLYFRDVHPVVFAVMLEIREHLLSVLPDPQEQLRWSAIAFDKPHAKASVKDNICYLRPRSKCVEIGFGLGVFLKDPAQLLRGNGRYKRFIPITTMKAYPGEAIRDLVLQSSAFDGNRVLYKLLPNDDYQALRHGI